VEVFRVEKRKFDLEVSKWDDTGNDIIVLAKHMCMIMMDMTDFTRGRASYVFSPGNSLKAELDGKFGTMYFILSKTNM
jgi:catenin alpha